MGHRSAWNWGRAHSTSLLGQGITGMVAGIKAVLLPPSPLHVWVLL